MSPWTVDEIYSLTSQPPLSGKKAQWHTFPTIKDSVRALREQVGRILCCSNDGSGLARDYMDIPGSTCLAECLFSISLNI